MGKVQGRRAGRVVSFGLLLAATVATLAAAQVSQPPQTGPYGGYGGYGAYGGGLGGYGGGFGVAPPTTSSACDRGNVCVWSGSGFSGARVVHGSGDFGRGRCVNESFGSLKNATSDQEVTMFSAPGCSQTKVAGFVGPGQEKASVTGQSLRIDLPE